MTGRDDDAAVDYEANVRQPGIEFELNHELGRDEQREIDRRAEWYRRMRQERGWA